MKSLEAIIETKLLETTVSQEHFSKLLTLKCGSKGLIWVPFKVAIIHMQRWISHVSPAHILWAGHTSVLSSRLWALEDSKKSEEGIVILGRPEMWQMLGKNMHALIEIQAMPYSSKPLPPALQQLHVHVRYLLKLPCLPQFRSDLLLRLWWSLCSPIKIHQRLSQTTCSTQDEPKTSFWH